MTVTSTTGSRAFTLFERYFRASCVVTNLTSQVNRRIELKKLESAWDWEDGGYIQFATYGSSFSLEVNGLTVYLNRVRCYIGPDGNYIRLEVGKLRVEYNSKLGVVTVEGDREVASNHIDLLESFTFPALVGGDTWVDITLNHEFSLQIKFEFSFFKAAGN